jgi:pimeloyl-ACP methyl ester carboxylesterase
MLHGFADTGDMWAPLAIVLARDHTVIVPDLRGMGLSSHTIKKRKATISPECWMT